MFVLGMTAQSLLVWGAWKTLLSSPERAAQVLDGIYEKASRGLGRSALRRAHRHWVARTHASADGCPCKTCGWAPP
jgi:hypothetical protein